MGLINETIGFKWLIDLLLFIGFVYFVAFPQTFGGECSFKDPDCGYDSYCGIDNKCHKFPYKEIIEEKQQSERKQPILISLLIGLALISGSYWYRKNEKK